MSEKSQNFLQRFTSALRRGVAGTADAFTGNRFDFDKQGSNEVINKQKIEKEQKKKLEEAAFEKKLADVRGGDLILNPDGTTAKAPDVEYGPKRRAADFLERFAGDQLYQNQLAGYNQTLLNQQLAASAERNRQNLETTLAFDRDSPTKMQERQLKAKTGEALLAEAVAKQASSAAEIGGLGTARRFGSGRVN